jgi:DNA-binding MarR family transcriptional regulator
MRSELKQKKAFPRPEEELCLSLIRTSDLLGRRISGLLRKHGLTTAQYNVLRILRGAGSEGLPCGEIGSRLITRDPDVTRLLDRMRRQGHVTRRRLAGDRRVITTRITKVGLRLLSLLDRPMVEEHKSQLGFLGGKKIRSLLDQLTRVRERLG